MSQNNYNFSQRSVKGNSTIYKFFSQVKNTDQTWSIVGQKYLSAFSIKHQDTSGFSADDDFLFDISSNKSISEIFMKLRFTTIFNFKNANFAIKTVDGAANVYSTAIKSMNLQSEDFGSALYDQQSGDVININSLALLNHNSVVTNGAFSLPKLTLEVGHLKSIIEKKFTNLFFVAAPAAANITTTFEIAELAALSFDIVTNIHLSVLVKN